MGSQGPLGVYPGSFDPLTIAHLAVAEAAVARLGLVRIDLAVSRGALGKGHLDDSSIAPRIEAIELAARSRPWLGAVVTDALLVAEIAEGYEVVVMGADKWAQVNDPAWYGGDADARDRAVAGLPRVAVAPRDGFPVPPELLLEVPAHVSGVSSSAVREGRTEWAANPPRDPAPGGPTPG